MPRLKTGSASSSKNKPCSLLRYKCWVLSDWNAEPWDFLSACLYKMDYEGDLLALFLTNTTSQSFPDCPPRFSTLLPCKSVRSAERWKGHDDPDLQPISTAQLTDPASTNQFNHCAEKIKGMNVQMDDFSFFFFSFLFFFFFTSSHAADFSF